MVILTFLLEQFVVGVIRQLCGDRFIINVKHISYETYIIYVYKKILKTKIRVRQIQAQMIYSKAFDAVTLSFLR